METLQIVGLFSLLILLYVSGFSADSQCADDKGKVYYDPDNLLLKKHAF